MKVVLVNLDIPKGATGEPVQRDNAYWLRRFESFTGRLKFINAKDKGGKMNFSKVMAHVYSGRFWRNVSEVCNGKRHPWKPFSYRPYRRGRQRCHECGARLGKIRCIRKSHQESLLDNIMQPNPILEFLKRNSMGVK